MHTSRIAAQPLALAFLALGAALLAAGARAAAPEQILIAQPNIYPESITSRADGSVIIGSLGTRQIFKAAPGAASFETWIAPTADTSLSPFGVFADEHDGTLWSCFSALPNAKNAQQSGATLKAFNLRTGKLKAEYPLPTGGAFCNDIAVDEHGAAYVTDTANMEIDRLAKGGKRLEVWAGNGDFGPKGGVLDGIAILDHRVFANALRTNKIFAVPIGSGGAAGSVTEITLSRPIEGPDGMRSFGKHSMLLVEGGAGRLSLLRIDGDRGTVTTIRDGFTEGPVAVTVVGTNAYLLEGHLSALFGREGAAPPPSSFHATAVAVGQPK